MGPERRIGARKSKLATIRLTHTFAERGRRERFQIAVAVQQRRTAAAVEVVTVNAGGKRPCRSGSAKQQLRLSRGILDGWRRFADLRDRSPERESSCLGSISTVCGFINQFGGEVPQRRKSLSSAQRRLWFSDRIKPISGMPITFLAGVRWRTEWIDPSHLKDALPWSKQSTSAASICMPRAGLARTPRR